MHRGCYVPVADRPYPFMAAVDVFQLAIGLMGGTKAENPSSTAVHFEREGLGEGEDHSHFLCDVR